MTIYTDEHGGYTGFSGLLYDHKRINYSAKEYVDGMARANGVESVWKILKLGINGTFLHVSNKHLNRYLDGFTFRLNEGNYEVDTID